MYSVQMATITYTMIGHIASLDITFSIKLESLLQEISDFPKKSRRLGSA